ncbi:MAG: hypothetical protein M1830_001794 [Pleopsidium flavum]|nr:MAG: hypothetical protein M1830_001794 [Pleopsidium flavum]
MDDLSSDLSSVGSLSPPPSPLPQCYPSPASSQELAGPNLLQSGMESLSDSLDADGPPPVKKRRIAEPKPRTTEYLDLKSISQAHASSQKLQLDLLLKVLRKRRKIVVVAGAGISVSAGIPDFRSSTGLFTTLRSEHKLKASGKHLFDASVYRSDSSTSSFHDMVRSLSHLVNSAHPTAFHHLLATLAHEGRLMRLYTQNVDGIDTSLPPLATSVPLSTKGPWPRTVQLHGGLEKMVCSKCNHLSDFQAPLFEGPEPPSCSVCEEMDSVRTNIAGKRSHGIGKLRPRIVLYNEHNPDEEAIGAIVSSDLRTRPDAIIVVGTSMKIPGVRRIVREMCGVVRGRRDGVAIWINHGPEPLGKEFEDCWDLIVRGDCDEVARQAGMGKWDEDDVGEFKECTESEVERAKEKGGEVKVVIETPKKKKMFERIEGVLTPIASPRLEGLALDKITVKAEQAQPRKTSKAKKLNPASKGLLISDLLKQRPTTSAKSKTSKKPAKQPKAASATLKINTAFKVTKSSNAGSTKAKSQSRGKVHPLQPMLPISPQAARNNGPTQPVLLFPNLQKPQKPQTTQPLHPNPQQIPVRKSSDTISPTGRLPPSLAMIMNE